MKKTILIYLVIFTFVLGTARAYPSGASQKMEKIVPHILLQNNPANPGEQMTSPRNFTLDNNENIYVFDYSDYGIRKYDRDGKFISSFGKKGEGERGFKHLMAIKVYGEKLYALDSTAILYFTPRGKFLNRRSFEENGLCNHPKVFRDGKFVGEQIIAGELKKTLSFRDANGHEINSLASSDLKEFFPKLEKGKDFFLNEPQTRFYLYDIDDADSIIWAASDKFNIYKYKNGKSSAFITGTGTPLPFPEDQRKKLAAQKTRVEKSMPLMHQYVPQNYQLLQHLFTGDGDIWIYLICRERTGLLRYSMEGTEKGFYPLEADFDITKSLVQIYKGKLYFMTPSYKKFKIYSAPVPRL